MTRTAAVSLLPCAQGRRGGKDKSEGPSGVEPQTLVHRLWACGFLSAFQAQRQARGLAAVHLQARAQAVGPGLALRQHRAGIGGQQARVEGCEAVAHFRGQPAGLRAPGPLRRQARGGLPGPQALHAARRRAPGGTDGQRQALAQGARVHSKHAPGAPFLIVIVFVHQQAPDRALQTQAMDRVRVPHLAAQFQPEAGLRVPPVMPQAQLHRGRQAVARGPREAPGTFQDHPQPVRLRVRRGQGARRAGHRVRTRPRQHGVRARGELEASGVLGCQQDPPAAEGAHDEIRVGLQGRGTLLQGQGPPAVPQEAPHVQPFGDGIPQIGMDARQGCLQVALAPSRRQRPAMV